MRPQPITARIPLRLLAAAGFLSSAGARVVDSLLDTIAQDFHVGVPNVALVLAAFTLPYGVLQLMVGPLADRVGKPKVLFGALLGYAIATAGCSMATGLLSLTLLRALAGAASAGLIPICLAYIGDATDYGERQIVLSRFLVGVVMAQILAGPVGGWCGEFVSWRCVFLLLAGGAFVLACLLGLRPGVLAERKTAGRTHRSYAGLWQPGPRRLLALTVVDGIVFTGTVPFIAPFLHERLGLSFGAAGTLLACFGIGTWAYIRLAPRLVAGLTEAKLVLAGGLVAALGMMLAATGHAWPTYVAAEILLGLGYFMLHSVLQARATEMLPDARGTAVSSFAFALFLGQATGALLCAAGIAIVGYRPVFMMDSMAVLGLGLLLWRSLRASARQRWRGIDYKAEQA